MKYNKEVADKTIAFIETLPSPEDPNSTIVLDNFQKDFITDMLAPLTENSKGETVRAVRQAVMSIARKNGKTTLIAALVLAFLVGPLSRYNQQIISAAFDREQAGIIYRTAKAIIDADAELSKYLRCVDSGKRILCPKNSSTYHSISSEARSKHGMNPSVIIFDELAQMGTNRELYDVLASSQGAQKQPLFIVISTQAPNDEAILSQLIDYGRSVNSGEVVDPSFVLCEYSCPSDEELALRNLTIWDEEVWYECNPALGSFRSIDEMRNYAMKAKNSPSMEMTFRNLYLNQRTSSQAVFVIPTIWNKCNKPFVLEELHGRPVHIGIDLSSRNDLTSLAMGIELDDGTFALHCMSFLPADTVAELARLSRAPYLDWIAKGYMATTPGSSIEYSFVAAYLLELTQKFDVRRINFDRWRWDILKNELLKLEPSFNTELLKPHGQGYKDMSPAVERVEELLLNTKLTHNGNPVLRWAFANAVLDKDAAGNRKLTKAKSYGKIDPAVASIMALGSFNRETINTFNVASLIA
jgi:phage terminase large subunit-like protein